ncbi:DNA-processing protein DprA [Pseudomonas aeruginosa]|uniref:DNA-processing protein DprA n=1 Tax=Pseudomonas aeruginosa TaxID=287 RepID=UPI001EBE9EE5|nr:DNA-processing protein DprA [Pseudomonas aeruginosa]MBX6882281.1 DNA-protecting protein DprA [Pseudomonas aeruginosa]MBX6932769.1 DNA-protecting protein DprA [Pseudomonas aeruginosa]MCZ9867084.1 DNA-protecting protein DprA [Pseudomonas aeruginosa]MCZ9906514.1 DNA-protecting protein DprA [Pseudomonas aeruginosa]WHV60870.1 DNA-protecting protein DprA [Pseudomonas aeruginosa]
MTDRLTTLIALGWLPGVGAATLRKAAAHDGIESMGSADLGAIDPRISRALAEAGAWDAAMRAAESDREQAIKAGVQLFTHGGPGYPALLGMAADAPFFLYVKGTLPLQNTLAVIGTRAPTPRGSVVASKIAGHFASSGVSIVSGLAVGIDAAAHVAALEAGGHTVAVLGHGLQTIYPREHAALAERILDQGGALVSEYPFGTPLVPRRLFERDRIQAGLSQAVVMVQSKPDGGSMHTAKAALRYGRRLYVPAPLDADLAGDNPAVEVPRMLSQGSPSDICELFRCEAERLAEIQTIFGREDYVKISQYMQDSAQLPAANVLPTQGQETDAMRNDRTPAQEPVWINPDPTTPLRTGPQSAEIEAKVAELQAQAAREHDLDAFEEIGQFNDSIIRLEKITDQMRRDNSAYALARKHLVQYYGFDGTPSEQDMLQVILDGMDASPVYRRTVEEEASDNLELALQAAAVVRDRAILAKEERKELDLQSASPSYP